MFQTFDDRMHDLTKNFVLQMAVIFFFTTLLANVLIILTKNKFEKDLAMYKYNILLERESELRKREEEISRYSEDIKREIIKRKELVGGMNVEPLPDLKEAPQPKKQRKGLFKRLKRKDKPKTDDFLKGVK